MSSTGEHKTGQEKIVITNRERELLEIVARIVTFAAPEIEARLPEDMILKRLHKAIEKFATLQEGTSESQ